jgi:ABC-type polysaccharide/polyol phosphate transport system ATPase subunit
MSDVVIRAEGLGKRYLIGHQATAERYTALRDVIARGARGLARSAADLLRGRPPVTGDSIEEVWALKDVSFEVKRGEVVGIIGRNGAGKSVLLKILSRITEPTAGRVTIRGRVASLLEVGTGFHPELTGRENIYLNGAILGMSRAEIRAKFDEIVAFAEVERFLDTPVKRYSSGMYVRLAFAVAAHLEPEILVVDEVLAVGDAEFQKRCLGKMRDVARGGRTVLFVSHNIGAVARLTGSALFLQNGVLSFAGPTTRAVQLYLGDTTTESGDWVDVSNAPRPFLTDGKAKIDGVRLTSDRTGVLVIEARGGILEPLPGIRMSFTICRPDGGPVGSCFGHESPVSPTDRHFHLGVKIDASQLAPGLYCLALAVGQGDHRRQREEHDILNECLWFEGGLDQTIREWSPDWGPIIFRPEMIDVEERNRTAHPAT